MCTSLIAKVSRTSELHSRSRQTRSSRGRGPLRHFHREHVRTSRTSESSIIFMMNTRERMGLWNRFTSFMSDRGDQPGPPSPKGGRHEQVPVASASYRIMEERDTLVGDVFMMCGGGVNPIGGDGRDDAIMSHDEHRPRTICQYYYPTRRDNRN